MRVIVIDSFKREVREATISDYKGIQSLIGEPFGEEKRFTVACDIGESDSVYVDDDGLYSQSNRAFFDVGAHQPFAGIGVVVGIDYETGESKDVSLTVEEIAKKVKFYSPLEIQLKVRGGSWQ